MNAGSFKKGEKRPNQGKRGLGKLTLKGREALTAVIEGNVGRLQGWLDQIERMEGPGAAFKAYVSLIEFGIPKMQRNELSTSTGPTTLFVSWGAVQEPAADTSAFTASGSANEPAIGGRLLT